MGFNKKTASEAGSKSRRGKGLRTKQWEALGESIMNEHTQRFNSILKELDDEKFIDFYLKTIEYFQPKLQRSELDIELDPNNINIPPIEFINKNK